MLFLESCNSVSLLKVIMFIKLLLQIVTIVVPIALIVMMMFDLVKNVVAGNEDIQKKNVSLLAKRVLMAVGVFFVMPIVSLFMNMLGALKVDWATCYNMANSEDIQKVAYANVDDIIANLESKSEITLSDLDKLEAAISYIDDTSQKETYKSKLEEFKGLYKEQHPVTSDDNDSGNNYIVVPGGSNTNIVRNISNMTLDEKIGQMLFIGISSSSKTSLSTSDKSILETIKPGGVVLMGYNIDTYNNTTKLISDIKATTNIPMFIATDQEGGSVQRLTSLTNPTATYIPNMYKLGQTKSTSLAYDVGVVMGEELSALGFNMDFAPVLDIWSNPNNTVIGNRSFGNDATTVTTIGIQVGKGLKNANIIPVYKHFPGHGDTTEDSHTSLPVVNKTKAQLNNLELIPFKSAIANGIEVIMVAHLALPNVTGNYEPSSLSKTIISDLLRNELGFKGVVITDDLGMGALDNYTTEQICKMAINAKVDMLLTGGNQLTYFNTIKSLVERGEISESTIDEAVTRIITLKQNSNLNTMADKSVIGSSKHQAVINKIG